MTTNINPPGPSTGFNGDEAGSGGSGSGGLADQAQSTAKQAAGQAQDKLREQLGQRSSQAAKQIDQQASDLRSVSQTLRDQGKEGPAKAADRLAGYGDKLGGYLREKDPDQLLADMEDFGRRQPWALAAGGLALGFAASRFLKASSSKRYRSRTASSQLDAAASPTAPRTSTAVDGVTPPAAVGPGASPVV